MSNKIINMVILEPSTIVFEGFSAIMSKTRKQCNIVKLNDFSELQMASLRKKIDIVIINPLLIQTNLKTFHIVKNELLTVKWIGLVYSFFDQQILTMFDEIIFINDNPNIISEKIHNALNSAFERDTDPEQETLSDRETDVLKLLVEGNANKEIADKLNISPHTVITHRKNISQKTGIKSVSGLTIYAVVKKIISIDKFKS